MSIDQPRTPAGSPEGGQFTATPGAEADGTLTGSRYQTAAALIAGYNEIPTDERADIETYVEQMVELGLTTPVVAQEVVASMTPNPETTTPASTVLMREHWGSSIYPDGSGTLTLAKGGPIELGVGETARLVTALQNAADEDYEYDMRDEWEAEHYFGGVKVTIERNDSSCRSSLVITRHYQVVDLEIQAVTDFDSPAGARRLATRIAQELHPLTTATS